MLANTNKRHNHLLTLVYSLALVNLHKFELAYWLYTYNQLISCSKQQELSSVRLCTNSVHSGWLDPLHDHPGFYGSVFVDSAKYSVSSLLKSTNVSYLHQVGDGAVMVIPGEDEDAVRFSTSADWSTKAINIYSYMQYIL